MMAQRADMKRPRFAENPATAPYPQRARRTARRLEQPPARQKVALPIAKKRRAMQRRILPVSQRLGALASPQAGCARSRRTSQPNMTAAIATTGNITTLTRYQPKCASIEPDTKDDIAMLPKIRKSLNA